MSGERLTRSAHVGELVVGESGRPSVGLAGGVLRPARNRDVEEQRASTPFVEVWLPRQGKSFKIEKWQRSIDPDRMSRYNASARQRLVRCCSGDHSWIHPG